MSMNDRKEPEATSSTDVESSQAAAAVSRVPEPVAPKEALIEESCILKIFHMSLRSYNVWSNSYDSQSTVSYEP